MSDIINLIKAHIPGTFEAWMREFRALAEPYVIGETYLEPRHWRERYDEGYSPSEAFEADWEYWGC